jgi:SHS2 domain-containing protein
MKKYEFFEHTADVGVRVWAHNEEEFFVNCANALFKLMVNKKEKGKYREEEINLEAESLEELLVNWLNELISIFFACNFLPVEYKVKIEEKPLRLYAQLKGEEFNPYQRKINTEIKAATYHNLKIEKDDKGILKGEVIFDV